MSRSYKKTPVIKDNTGMKVFANRKFRRKLIREDDAAPREHGHYKRNFEQWDISDYMFWETNKEQWIRFYLEYHPRRSYKEAERQYRKYYVNK